MPSGSGQKYGDTHAAPPIWVAVEVLSFGKVVRLYKGSPPFVQKRVAEHFNIASTVLESWLLSLNTVRNICAHHGRLWNRELSHKPKLPRLTRERENAEWHIPYEVPKNRIFGSLTILAYVLGQIAPGSGWANRLDGLLEQHPEIPLAPMGFPANWRESSIWKKMLPSRDPSDSSDE